MKFIPALIMSIIISACAVSPISKYRQLINYHEIVAGDFRIEVDNSLKNVAVFDEDFKGLNIDLGTSKVNRSIYIFTDGKNDISRGAIIQIDRLVESQTYYWRAENYDQYNKQDMIGKGYRVLGDLRCSNVVRKVVNIPDWLIKSLRDAGCTIGKFKCAIESDYVINSTYTLIRICYIEGMNICDQVSHQAIHDNAERVLRLSKN